MLYTVKVIKNEKFVNKYKIEMTDEMEVESIKHKTSSAAEKTALKLAEKYNKLEGDYEIYVHYLHRDSPCFLNPSVGHEPVGKSWM